MFKSSGRVNKFKDSDNAHMVWTKVMFQNENIMTSNYS